MAKGKGKRTGRTSHDQRETPREPTTEASAEPSPETFPEPSPELTAVPTDVPAGEEPYEPAFPIVGIGASAGGLEACTQFLRELPAKTGMAFVLVQHLAPAYESALPEIIARVSKLPVHQVRDEMTVEPNHLYVIPPNTDLVITRGRLQLGPREMVRGQFMPIDRFLRSLAVDQGSRAIGVILSGNASDGALGIEAIKAEGGITFAQDEHSAKYPGMPHSAIATGCVDFILPPEGIANEITRIGRHPYVAEGRSLVAPELLPAGDDDLTKIFQTLRIGTGVDFTYYKYSTVYRRIHRRMAVNKIEDVTGYVRYLRESPAEVKALYQELLVPVTSFFREPEAFEALKAHVFRTLMQGRAPDETLRIWVPGCSTGEEIFSLAICLLEVLGDQAATTPVQIFATDVSEPALDKARAGVYAPNIAQDVSPERLRRFFVKGERGYQISKGIRDLCIFARQDITKDPPFSKLDLISCRNVLIYFTPILHKRILPIFHYALKPAGFLLLGSSETTGTASELFRLIDKRHKLYAKRPTATRPILDLDLAPGRYVLEEPGTLPLPKARAEIASDLDVQREADRVILTQYAPAGVLVNDQLEIVQFRGDTSPYLAPPAGRASFNLFKMAREGLHVELRAATTQARKNGSAVTRQGITVRYRGALHEVNVKVVPIKVAFSADPYLLVLFEEAAVVAPPEERPDRARAQSVKQRNAYRFIARLEQELATAKETLETTVQDHEATTEELKAANEEILSSNEELQTTNEELQTAKEELQSNNEELTTVNEELQNRNAELSLITDDLSNLLGSVNLPIVMLGNDMRIRRFTPMAGKVLGLIATDIGRPIGDLRLNLQVSDLEQKLIQVVDAVTPVEQEIQDRDGHWYSLRIRPYRTRDNKIDGAVMAFVDVDALRRSLDELRQLAAIVESSDDAIFSTTLDGTILSWNRGAERTYGYTAAETGGRSILMLFPPDRSTELPESLERIARGERVDPHETVRVRKDGTRLEVALTVAPIRDADGRVAGAACIGRDITERKRTEARQALVNRELEMLLHVISHDLKEPLRAIENFSSIVHERYAPRVDEKGQDLLRRMEKAAARMRLQLEDILTLSRARRMGHPAEEVEGEALVREVLERLKPTIESTHAKLHVAAGLPRLRVDRTWATEAIYNLLANAIKFTREGEAPDVEVAPYQSGLNDGSTVGIVVRDRGIGVERENAERIFELFQRAVGPEVEGEGAGLAIVFEVARRHGGRVWVQPRDGGGSEFIITFAAGPQPDAQP